jgi:thiol:disulfide interchange protein DsbC
MLKRKLALLLATGLIASCVGAETTTEAGIRKAIEPRLGGAKIDSIKETPYSGLYELRVAGDILYTDKKGDYLFIGHVYDTKSQQDLTRARIDDINKIKFSELPLDMAIKQVKGDGKRVIRTAATASACARPRSRTWIT